MSLKTDYYDGETGLHNQLNLAFDAGVAFVGSGVAEVDTLSLGDRNGTNLGAGGGNPGLYFDAPASNGLIYRVWIKVTTEVAPSLPTTNYIAVEVDILAGDSSTIVATKIAAALNVLPSESFDASSEAEVVTIVQSMDGVLPTPISVGTLGGTAAVAQVTAGVNPTGNFMSLQSIMIASAAQGLTIFTVTIPTSFNPVYLRGNNGRVNLHSTGNTMSSVYAQQHHGSNIPDHYGNNLLLKAYLAGIQAGLADQNIYNYECSLDLNTSDNVTTSIDFNFHFQTT